MYIESYRRELHLLPQFGQPCPTTALELIQKLFFGLPRLFFLVGVRFGFGLNVKVRFFHFSNRADRCWTSRFEQNRQRHGSIERWEGPSTIEVAGGRRCSSLSFSFSLHFLMSFTLLVEYRQTKFGQGCFIPLLSLEDLLIDFPRNLLHHCGLLLSGVVTSLLPVVFDTPTIGLHFLDTCSFYESNIYLFQLLQGRFNFRLLCRS
mmetsp:Transcript_35816/g.77415  ORF Transcript_35816/g.77415 Transcript_35816/m.77415 type:complete len:205 (+) Transcript_35816:2-616(+)